ncbi:hypothetical protein OYT13_16665 [Pandoraea sp. XJJ-1]|uniref:hypothetical protein n=1 Tax=Pandoraea sp. XJJ-1 TaxID=3002643 RepID=UPI00227FCB76|nr:hypothetical protein [Pandoraea sp. XJJ-1]WAL81472.1 hypothetical protein OYT13_16665 [Pandoraea sp. XJJ-1]
MRSLNQVPMAATATQARGAVKLNDTLITGWVSWEAESNGFYSADTFRVTFVADMLPSDRDARWFSEQEDMFVELFGGYVDDPDRYELTDLVSELYGRVDDIDFDIVAGTIELVGRDLTSVFIDAKTTEKWPNLTASQIATQLAQRRGLKPVVTATSAKAGKYYEIDHVNLTDQRSEWDLLAYLAHIEGFVVYVKGKELHFEPKTDPDATPYLIQWVPPDDTKGYPEANVVDMKFSRALTVSRGIQVVVRTWNAKQKKGFTVSYPNKGKTTQAGKAKPFGGAQIYSYTIPGLTQEQALERAQKIHAELIAHEMKLQISRMPADSILGVTTMVEVAGTDTAWDQKYFPDSVVRRMSMPDGYVMSLNAKNHAPDSTVTL